MEDRMIKELRKWHDDAIYGNLYNRLAGISDAYPDFIIGILIHVSHKPSRMQALLNYLDRYPNATSSDVVEFVSFQPDFFDDDRQISHRLNAVVE